MCARFAYVRASGDHALVERALHSARNAPAQSVCHEDGTRYEQFVREQALLQTLDEKRSSTRQLFEWCREDAACCKAYHMRKCQDAAAASSSSSSNSSSSSFSPYSDFETFRYLVAHWHAPEQPLTTLLDAGEYCGHARRLGARHVSDVKTLAPAAALPEEPLKRMLRSAWLLEMRLQSYENRLVQCADNEHFVYSPAAAEGRCVCNAANSDECHAVRRHRRHDPWNHALTAVIVVAVCASILMCLNSFTLLTQLSTYDEFKIVLRERKAQDKKPGAADSASIDDVKDRFLKMLHRKRS
jgi:hypothetical protein